MPTKPISNPRIPLHVGFTPLGRIASAMTKNIGTDAMISAAMPEGMNCSAQETNPLPPSRSRLPMIAVEIHCLRVGNGYPAARCQITRITPERKNRTAA